MKILSSFWVLALLVCANSIVAEDAPIQIVPGPIGGHIHPSICQVGDNTLVVVYQGKNVLMCSRSTDVGKTWSKPVAIETTAKRPDSIRKAPRFEIYPGTADTLSDGRILVTWNYIADDKGNDGYYERALLFTLSSDKGRSWSPQGLIGPINKHHLGAVRHNVLEMSGQWLLPLRVGQPRLYDPKTAKLTDFPVVGADGKKHEFQQIVRTSKGALLAMGPVLLRSTDDGKTWKSIDGFPAIPDKRDNAEGRYLTVLNDGGILVTWGIGHKNKGLRFNLSTDDGMTWDEKRTRILLPDTDVKARYYSARTIQLDPDHVGAVFMNSSGVYFLPVAIKRFE
ncbi:MAG: hypothetical protein CMJ78_03355 [Planctomycetaceae bacterium]|nr:hypothetical protein [Planctomycetaceae bacterium]